MKLSNASLNRPPSTFGDHVPGDEASHQGARNILGRGRTAATWSQVSPEILGDIDAYVRTLARR